MSWQLIAETETKQTLYDEWKAELYVNSSTTVTSDVYDLLGDFKLTRGNSGTRDTFGGITATQITFALRDKNNILFEAFSGLADGDARLILYRNGSIFFKGNLLLTSTKKEVILPTSAINFKAFDGLSRLKEFDDWSDILDTRTKLHALLRKIFSALEFDLDIYIFSNFYKGQSEEGAEFPFDGVLVFIDDYLASKNDATYYDVLEYLAKQLNLEIFQENGFWVVRQNVSVTHVTDVATDGIILVKVSYADGSVKKGKVSLDETITDDDLSKITGFRADSYAKVIIENEYGEKRRALAPSDWFSYSETKRNQVWENSEFKRGSQGWETVSGAPLFVGGSLLMENGDEVKQTTPNFYGGEKVKFSAKADCSRMVLDSAQSLLHVNIDGLNHDNPLFRIKYIADDGSEYYLFSSANSEASTNGDVEDGTANGWTTDSGNTMSVDSSRVHGGSYSLSVDAEAHSLIARNTLNFSNSGGKVTAEFYIDHYDTSLSPMISVKIIDPDGTETTKRVLLAATGWQRVTIEADDHTSGTGYLEIIYLDDTDESFWIDDLSVREQATDGYAWRASSPSPDANFGISVLGVQHGVGNYLEIYSTATFEWETEINLPQKEGHIEVSLFGGGVPSGNNYAGEYGAIHRKFDVEVIEAKAQTDAPNAYVYELATGEGKEKTVAIPFHDMDPYGNASFWYITPEAGGYFYYRTIEWKTPVGTEPLVEALARLLLEFHQYNEAFDLLFLSNHGKSFNSLLYYDGKYFLPVYEETLLIDDKKRLKILRHERKTISATETKYFKS